MHVVMHVAFGMKDLLIWLIGTGMESAMCLE